MLTKHCRYERHKCDL